MGGRARLVALAVFLSAVAASPVAAASVIKGGHPVCDSAEHIEDAVRAIDLGDRAWFERLKGCHEPDPGIAIERLDGGFLWWGICRARIGYGKIVWTPCANIEND